MGIRVRLPGALRDAVGGASQVDADGSNLGELLQNLTRRFPALRGRIFDATGSIQRSVTVLVNGEDVLDLDGLYTDIHDADDVVITAER
jgi:molybdopterin converting factor small subunit